MSIGRRQFLILVGVFAVGLLWLSVPVWKMVRSANLTNASVTLSTPRLSFYGRLNAGNVVGSSTVVLSGVVSGGADGGSTSSANLFERDNVLIGTSNYAVLEPVSTGSAVFSITGLTSTPGVTALTASNNAMNTRVIATRSASLVASFSSVTGMTDGKYRFLVPAGSTSGSGNDGIPDRDGWDLTGATGNLQLTCTVSGTGGPWVAATSTQISQVVGSATYHIFTCDYTGQPNIPAGRTITMTVASSAGGTAAGYSGPINPAPNTTHALGFADIYNPVIQLLNSSNNTVDQTTVGVAAIDSVLVRATVPPQVVFRIVGKSTSDGTFCGNTSTVNTTASQVPFGLVPLNTYVYAAQELIVSTNAGSGYVVTAIEDDSLHRAGVTCPAGGCIPDSTGDTGVMTYQNKALWTSVTAASAKGFGYSLQNNVGGTPAFTHSDSTGTCTGAAGNCWKDFSNNTLSQAAEPIYSYTSTADNHSFYVCYKVIVGSTQQAGDYTTGVTYRATATF
jgi:hypothetical protein